MSDVIRVTRCFALVSLLGLTAAVRADEISDQQKTAALANLKRCEIKDANVVASEHFLVCSRLTEAKAKALAEALEKVVPVARKGLQFEEKEAPWKGKLTIYHLPERKEYNLFMRTVAGERPAGDFHLSPKGAEPYILSGYQLPAKATETELTTEVRPLIAAAMLQAKYGSTEFPDWVRMGFGRVASVRSDNALYIKFKTQAKKAVGGGKSGLPAAPISAIWGEKTKDSDLLATSLMDYLAFGPGMKEFPKLLAGFRPLQNGDQPTREQALEAAGWKPATLEKAWWDWVQTSK